MAALVFGAAVMKRLMPLGMELANVGIPLDATEAEARAKVAYSLIGDEYYGAYHVTSRNFDETISAFLAENPLEVCPGFRYLEVGCGRSRLNRFPQTGSQFVLLDLCARMLQHSIADGLGSSSRPLLGSAFGLPFRDGVFRTVFSFLGDPFLHPTYLAELRRVLVTGGNILHIVPSHDWGGALRASRGEPIHLSHFFRGSLEAFGPSFLRPKSEMSHLLSSAGFSQIRLGDLFLPETVPSDRVSPDIAVPAKLRGVRPHELPILNVIHAVAA
jgi:SAM-dependent methyltransferase